ncbi:HD domain-containing protein [Shouchella shacheensis]|uniref:HD domain-containing protein n=1 Tax=Shouchella shacheensis TaxID=1649580 RepID=UPI000740037B|nr:HD domain-containing protein [Shouchella shacheensis]
MLITDTLYGTYELEDVLTDLIHSAPVQRLKGIHQGGASFLVNPEWNVTRYDHSIGVMLLVRKLGGSLEEQIAALLHDVSHTAFSHVIDFVLEQEKEDFHEQIYDRVIEDSELPVILKEHGYNYADLLFNEWKWTLLEQEAPALCADRIDYTLRDMYHYGQINNDDAQTFLASLTVKSGRIYVSTIQAAEWFTETYYKEVIEFFMHPKNLYGYKALTNVLQSAFKKGLIGTRDFLSTDDELLSTLENSADEDITKLLLRIHPDVKVEENKHEYDFHIRNKVRLVDPPVLMNGTPVPGSHLSEQVVHMQQKTRKRAEEGSFVKVVESERWC